MGETGIAKTVIGPIRRQEPGHYAFYQLSARALWAELAAWQRWMVRLMRRVSFAPVGANNDKQKADFGDVMTTLGITDRFEDFAEQISRVERELLWARTAGSRSPTTSPRRSARPSSWPGARAGDLTVEPAPLSPGQLREPQHPLGDPGDVGGGRGRGGRGLHDVAEHDPHDHVDGGVELVRRSPMSYGATRAATTVFAAASSDSACVVSSGSSSVSAPWVAETTACSSRLSWASSSTARTRRRIAATRSSGARRTRR